MRLMPLALICSLLPTLAAADPTLAPLPVPAGSIAISSPGTADLAGYKIVVAPSGESVAVDLAGRSQHTLSPQLTKTLFADAAAAMPLSKLPAAACTQPSVIPAPIIVIFNGETSPDIVCLTDVRATALLTDAQTIAHALYVSNLRSRALPRFAAGAQTQTVTQPAAPPPPPAPAPGGYGGYGHM
jgi:hypothetical protein